MYTVHLNSFAEWRAYARQLNASNTSPNAIMWVDGQALQLNLLADNKSLPNLTGIEKPLRIPRRFLELAQSVACHRSPGKWHLLYSLLWRLSHKEPNLLEISSDPLVNQLFLMEKSVRRDCHKMKAFVRFRKIEVENVTHYMAWHQPDHIIIKLVATFFKKRFNVLNWTIMTPDGTASWDGENIHFSEGIARKPLMENDEYENLWRTYYRSIFNPARIKIKAMKKEMPVRYWHNLPEATIIYTLLQEAPQQMLTMLQQQEKLKEFPPITLPKDLSISSLQHTAATCQSCPLYRDATQTVFGKGPEQANLFIIGEQPGDQEDKLGVPFVGPAGKFLYTLLEAAGIVPENSYITNAVKHFKFKLEHNRRIHASPNVKEIVACKPWLEAEIAVIKPKVILCLGLTAARSLINKGYSMKEQRGKWITLDSGQLVMVTYHPAAILRVKNDFQQAMKEAMLADIKMVASYLNQ
jgi:probable DNA metabolism protein